MLEDAPETLINSALEGFETQPDVASIGRINDSGKKISQLWQEEEDRHEMALLKLRSELRDINAEIETLKKPADDILTSLHLSTEEIQQLKLFGNTSANFDVFTLINERTENLDTAKISLARQLSELDTSASLMRVAEMNLDRRTEEIAAKRALALSSNINTNFDSTTMKIVLFKKFGIHIEESETGGNDKILIFSERKSEPATVLEVDEKFSDYFISNFIWDHVGGEDDNQFNEKRIIGLFS